MQKSRLVLWGVSALAAIIIIGVIGYTVIEGWTLLDSLYMTIMTITTVGYGEVHPLTSGGRIFSIFLMVGGVGEVLYVLSVIVAYVMEGTLGTAWEKRRMKNKIAGLKGHFILCGLGRVGEDIARTFSEEGVPFVAIDNRPDCVERAEQAGYLCLTGDATNDEVLKEAGIERARGLVAAVGADADNTYITLSARVLRPDLFIEARASSREAEIKLKRAGADRIVLPYSIGARRMAMLALRPGVVDFIDTITYGRGREMQLENIIVSSNSALVGQTAGEARNKAIITILAIQRKSGRLIPNPSDEEIIEESDRLIIIGTSKRLAELEEAPEGEVKQ